VGQGSGSRDFPNFSRSYKSFSSIIKRSLEDSVCVVFHQIPLTGSVIRFSIDKFPKGDERRRVIESRQRERTGALRLISSIPVSDRVYLDFLADQTNFANVPL